MRIFPIKVRLLKFRVKIENGKGDKPQFLKLGHFFQAKKLLSNAFLVFSLLQVLMNTQS